MIDYSKDLKSYNPFASGGGSSIPNIGGYKADAVNVNDIVQGKAKAADWGAGVGGAIGAFFGAPQQGANIGRVAFPALENVFKNLF